ncbi:Transmembrane_domain-containing protein [Hexamita inflata]|uniref:Transmembrane domain-containing protein n=1 Tax=Hexamita inflata TaxID=28002 RepID=A0AA86TMS6_9EUKA|nr:Transmembrane domain-containing protein [Hexamita inflata]
MQEEIKLETIKHPNDKQNANKLISIFLKVQKFLQPTSYSEQGSSRIVSIDVLRGIAIFCTCFIHEVSLFLDVNIILKLKMPEALLGYIIGLPSMLFSQWKTLFTIICGMTYAYLGNDALWSVKKLSVEFLKRTIVSFIQLPLFFFFNVLLNYFWLLDYQWNKTAPHPFVEKWYTMQNGDSAACWFYGCTFCFLHFIAYSVNLIAKVFQRKSTPQHVIYYQRAVIYMIYAIIIGFVTNQVQVSTFNFLKNKYPATFANVNMLECAASSLGNQFSPNTRQGLQNMFIAFISGAQCFVFPLWTNLFFGCMFGCFFRAVVLHRQQMNNHTWMKLRKRYLLVFGFSFVIPLILWGFQSWITISDIKAGRRMHFQSIKRLATGEFYYNCYMPELVFFDDIFMFLAVFTIFFLFDAQTSQKSIARTNNSLYLRRFSTGSLTCYVFSPVLGGFIRGLLPSFNKQSMYQFFGIELLVFIIQLFMFIGLDYSDWMFTPDWIVSFTAKAFQCKFKCGQLSKCSHLKVKPLNIFEKVSDYDEIGEGVGME